MSARWLNTFITTALTLGVVGCSGDSKNEDTAMQHEFSWVIEDQLAGMPRPGTDAAIEDDVAFLKRQNIDLSSIAHHRCSRFITAGGARYRITPHTGARLSSTNHESDRRVR